MSANSNSQLGCYSPSELLIGNDENDSDIDQLRLSIGIVPRNEPSSIQFNPTNMIVNIQQYRHTLRPNHARRGRRRHQQQFLQRQERQRQQEEQQRTTIRHIRTRKIFLSYILHPLVIHYNIHSISCILDNSSLNNLISTTNYYY